MTREIKFRAWNGKKMQSADCIDWGDSQIKNVGEIFRVYTGGYHFRGDEKREGWGRLEDVKLMQYTGLKDKNGKEIYEGDILDVDNDWYKVDFSFGAFNGNGLRGIESMILSEIASSRDCCIIGNIYENPELLQAK